MNTTAPGVTEYELESVIEHTFRTQGGNGPGYTSMSERAQRHHPSLHREFRGHERRTPGVRRCRL